MSSDQIAFYSIICYFMQIIFSLNEQVFLVFKVCRELWIQHSYLDQHRLRQDALKLGMSKSY